MLNFLVGWVKSAKSGLLATNPVSLPDYVWIAEPLNPTPDSTLSGYDISMNNASLNLLKYAAMRTLNTTEAFGNAGIFWIAGNQILSWIKARQPVRARMKTPLLSHFAAWLTLQHK